MNYSRQRESILEYLKNTKEHPTAERIYSDLKEAFPNLSLATVYRNCNRLCESGQVIRLTTNGKTDHFDADTSDHQHFVCTTCDRVYDLYFRLPEGLVEQQLEEGFQISTCQFYAFGTCRMCKKETSSIA